MTTFHVKINDGPEQVIRTRTGVYQLAALAALSMLEYDEADDGDIVEIWCPNLVPEYGPYFYGYDGHQIYTVVKR